MTSLPVIQEAATALFDQFEIETELEHRGPEREMYERVKKLLSDRIRYLIDHDMEHFLNVLYRIDVNEQKVKQVLAEYPLTEAIEAIAVLIIERQQQKVITRRMYSPQTGNNDDELSW